MKTFSPDGRVAFIAAALALAALMGACSPASSGASAASQSPDPPSASVEASSWPSWSVSESSPSSQVSPTPRPSSTPSPTPTSTPKAASTPQPTPPAAGQPWGGLVWSDPVPVDLPWGHAPALLMSWQGSFIGIDVADLNDGTSETVVASSPDGGKWTVLAIGAEAPFTNLQIGRVAATPSGLVAVGTIGEQDCHNDSTPNRVCDPATVMVWTSTDGRTWDGMGNEAIFGEATITDVAYGPHGLVAVGNTGFLKPAMWTSADGTAWTRLDSLGPQFGGAILSAIMSDADRYILSGSVGDPPCGVVGCYSFIPTIWTSPDGRSWSKASMEQPKGPAQDAGRVYVTRAGFLAVGWQYGAPGYEHIYTWESTSELPLNPDQARAAWTSSDGRTWRLIAEELHNRDVWRAWPLEPSAADQYRLIAVRSTRASGLEVSETLDGVNWHSLTLSGYEAALDGDIGMLLTPNGVVVLGWLAGTAQNVVIRGAATP